MEEGNAKYLRCSAVIALKGGMQTENIVIKTPTRVFSGHVVYVHERGNDFLRRFIRRVIAAPVIFTLREGSVEKLQKKILSLLGSRRQHSFTRLLIKMNEAITVQLCHKKIRYIQER